MPFKLSRKDKKPTPQSPPFPIPAPSSVYSQQTNFPSMPASPPRRPSSAAFFHPLATYSAVGPNPFALEDDDGEVEVSIPAPNTDPNPVPVTPPQHHHRPSSTAFFNPLAAGSYSTTWRDPFSPPDDNRVVDSQTGNGLLPQSPCSTAPIARSPYGAGLLSSRLVSPLSSRAGTPLSSRPVSPFTIPSSVAGEPPVTTEGNKSSRGKPTRDAPPSHSAKPERTKTSSSSAQTPRDNGSSGHRPRHKSTTRLDTPRGSTRTSTTSPSNNTKTSSTKTSSKPSSSSKTTSKPSAKESHKHTHACTGATCCIKLDPTNLSAATKMGIYLMGTTPSKLERAARAQREKRRERRRRDEGRPSSSGCEEDEGREQKKQDGVDE